MSYKYPVFNEQAWNYNVNKTFSLIAFSSFIPLVLMMLIDFKLSIFMILYYLLFSWAAVVVLCALFEALAAVILKVALTPGMIVNNPLMIFKIYLKTYNESVKNFFTSYKKVTSYHVSVAKSTLPFIEYLSLSGNGITLTGQYGPLSKEFFRDEFIEIPEHFKI